MELFPFAVWKMSAHSLIFLRRFSLFRAIRVLSFFIYSRFFTGIVCIEIVRQCIVMLQFDVSAPEFFRFPLYHFIVFLQFLFCIVNFNGCERQFNRQLMTTFTISSRGSTMQTGKEIVIIIIATEITRKLYRLLCSFPSGFFEALGLSL